ncbi:MAG: RHS repeat-associated core domain-containing protein [Candidatus Omnitrophota bacterium]
MLRKNIFGVSTDEILFTIDYPQSTTYYYNYDGLGSVSEITDENGSVIEKYTYNIYGKVTIKDANDNILTESAIGNRYFFTGRELDEETGLYYYRNRYYDPEIGRFITPDPIGYASGINLYTYCGNDPVNWIDPFGLDWSTDEWEKYNTMNGGPQATPTSVVKENWQNYMEENYDPDWIKKEGGIENAWDKWIKGEPWDNPPQTKCE